MPLTAEQVLTAALELPDADRVELIAALIESVQLPDCPPFDESWREVIRRRAAELASGSVAAVPPASATGGPAMAAALEALAEAGGPSDFGDPAEWEREARAERPLPGRDA